jgi:CRP/FNR family cyclic AMP-dependent transcriptional regulator
VLVADNQPQNNLVRLLPKIGRSSVKHSLALHSEGWPDQSLKYSSILPPISQSGESEPSLNLAVSSEAEETDPLYLFACQVEWKKRAEPGAAWEVISASRSLNSDTRAHAMALLDHSLEPKTHFAAGCGGEHPEIYAHTKEDDMKAPMVSTLLRVVWDANLTERSVSVSFRRRCGEVWIVPATTASCLLALSMFVEGQSPRGVYLLCSGKVKLSTTSKEGKVLILKQAEAGEVLGLSAAVSGTNYEMTAETSTPCQVNFIGRLDLMGLLQRESEVGVHAAQSLSREFQNAYRDMHDLVLARSSSGKLARLLLSCASSGAQASTEQKLRSAMIHEEMAQRIGSSRETVTRLLSSLKKKRLIRVDGATLVIRDRTGLEALVI